MHVSQYSPSTAILISSNYMLYAPFLGLTSDFFSGAFPQSSWSCRIHFTTAHGVKTSISCYCRRYNKILIYHKHTFSTWCLYGFVWELGNWSCQCYCLGGKDNITSLSLTPPFIQQRQSILLKKLKWYLSKNLISWFHPRVLLIHI